MPAVCHSRGVGESDPDSYPSNLCGFCRSAAGEVVISRSARRSVTARKELSFIWCGLSPDPIGSIRHHFAISTQSLNPDGSWRPILACSNMPQPSAPLHLARATWSTTLYGSIPVTSGEAMS